MIVISNRRPAMFIQNSNEGYLDKAALFNYFDEAITKSGFISEEEILTRVTNTLEKYYRGKKIDSSKNIQRSIYEKAFSRWQNFNQVMDRLCWNDSKGTPNKPLFEYGYRDILTPKEFSHQIYKGMLWAYKSKNDCNLVDIKVFDNFIDSGGFNTNCSSWL